MSSNKVLVLVVYSIAAVVGVALFELPSLAQLPLESDLVRALDPQDPSAPQGALTPSAGAPVGTVVGPSVTPAGDSPNLEHLASAAKNLAAAVATLASSGRMAGTAVDHPGLSIDAKLNALENKLKQEIYRVTGATQSLTIPAVYQAVALSSRIDSLGSVSISAPIISGGTWSNGSFSGTFSGTVSGDQSLGTTTLTSLTVSNLSTSTFGGGVVVDGNLFVVDSSSNKVGIGTTSPSKQLDIYGSGDTTVALRTEANSPVRLHTYSNRTGANKGLFTLQGFWNNTEVARLELQSGDDTTNKNDGDVAFLTAEGGVLSEAFRIKDSGNVGIGTSSPYAKLSIVGETVARNFVATSTSATSTFQGVILAASGGSVGIGTTSPWRTLSISGTVAAIGLTSSATGNAVCITTGKDITDAGGGTCTPSSERFKENIETLSVGTALSELSRLRVVSFDYREGFFSPEDGPASIGLIAEEVANVDPRLVDYGYDGRPLTLHFERLTGLAVQAIQELDARIENLARAVNQEVYALTEIAVERITARSGSIDELFTQKICIDDLCLTKNDLEHIIRTSRIHAPTESTAEQTGGPDAEEATDTEPPVITLFGNNPARVPLQSTYVDLGAAVTDNVDHNLGYTRLPESIDTTTAASYTLTFTATDSAGNTATTTRMVIVYDPTEEAQGEVLTDPATTSNVMPSAES